MSRIVRHCCGECQQPFNGLRRQKYCSVPCAKAVAKKQKQAWERAAKRPPHLYRTRKAAIRVQQSELDLG